MSSNYSNLNILSIYKLYFDDIEEIFLNTVSFKYLFISSLIICFFILASIITLNQKQYFLHVLYHLYIVYYFIQLLSIILLKYNLKKIHLITLNESNYEINVEQYSITFYGRNHVKLNDYQQFYLDLEKYAQNYEKTQIKQNKSKKNYL
ncbi:unnamed protein product [Rotaria sp. Silwood1]|nr:unnamed protein product [Rotaria sp. Silwood1]CAF1655114.1 unnamed protein product [Rotaria sp. Silwood1]